VTGMLNVRVRSLLTKNEARALEQLLKDHPKLTREEALARLKAAGL
jgi:hypothetical protein